MAGDGSGLGGFSVSSGDGDAMAGGLIRFTEKTVDELMEAMLYQPRDPMDLAGEMFSRWWSNNRDVYLHIGRNKCHDYYMTLARQIQREFVSSRKGRCERCGAKILTMRCLACDRREEMRCERGGLDYRAVSRTSGCDGN